MAVGYGFFVEMNHDEALRFIDKKTSQLTASVHHHRILKHSSRSHSSSSEVLYLQEPFTSSRESTSALTLSAVEDKIQFVSVEPEIESPPTGGGVGVEQVVVRVSVAPPVGRPGKCCINAVHAQFEMKT